MFPLSAVLFPHAPLTLHVFEPRYRRLAADCLAGARELGVVLITRGSEVGGGDQRASVGTLASIERAVSLPDGRWFLLLMGTRRIRVVQWLPDDPYPRALVEELPDRRPDGSAGTGGAGAEDPGGRLGSALERALLAVRVARGLASEAGRGRALPGDVPGTHGDPGERAWRLCHEAPVGALDRQRMLEAHDATTRLELVGALSAEVADDLRRLLAGG
jgi:uncharacterized protein